jgi:hypothetical protein
VNSTEVVAIIGGSSTVGVAVAGYAFNYFTAGRLARQAQRHERELADAAHATSGSSDKESVPTMTGRRHTDGSSTGRWSPCSKSP